MVKEVNLFVVKQKAEVTLLQHKRNACRLGAEPEHVPHFPLFLLRENLHVRDLNIKQFCIFTGTMGLHISTVEG